jgi:uncharacterized cupredoxin-like copper-binding protein
MHERHWSRRRGVLAVLAIAPVALVAVGCGGSSSSSSSTTPTASASSTTSGGATSQSTASTQSGTSTGSGVPAPAPSRTSTSGSATTVLNVSASASELAFVPNTLSAPAGRVMIRMSNPSQLQHSVALAVAGVAPGPVVGNGGVSEVVANLAPGTYTFYCTVPGHRDAGMTGTLTVR